MGKVAAMHGSKAIPLAGLRAAATLPLAVGQIALSVLLFQQGFNADAQAVPIAVRNPASPAGYAFAIWGVIYLGCLAFAAAQALPSRWNAPFYRRLGWWPAVGFALCCLWLLAARIGPIWLTMPIIAAMLLALGRAFVIAARASDAPTRLEWRIAVTALGVYAGWLSAATFVNFADVAPGFGFERFGLSPEGFGRLILLMASGTGLAFVFAGGNRTAYVLTVIWALAAIAVSNGGAGGERSVLSLSLALITVLIVAAAAQRLRRGR
jgi:hypothetical protein